MLTPLQQTPIPLDPVRQQITPPAPVEAPAPPRPADIPVQANEGTRDKFNPNSGNRGGSRQGQALEDQQKAETASKLRSAYLRLNELQREASAAVAAGNPSRAKELAAEAAEVAQSIPADVGVLETGGSGGGSSQPAASGGSAGGAAASDQPAFSGGSAGGAAAGEQQTSGQPAVSGGSAGGPTAGGTTTGGGGTSGQPTVSGGSAGGVMDVPGAIDLARAGLGTAKNVVDSAASMPSQPMADRIAIDGMRQQVLVAMAGVEEIAARVSESQVSASPSTVHVDLSA